MRVRVAACLVVAASLLGACGGGDGGEDRSARERPAAVASRSAEERRVRSVVRETLMTEDPEDCARLLTQAAIEQFTFRRGRAALAECRDNADEDAATAVEITRVDIDGARAEAVAEPKGGGLTMRTATFSLLKDGGRWKIDRLKAGTLDRAAFMRYGRKELREPPSSLSEEATHCVMRELRSRPDEVLVRIFVASDLRTLLVPTVVCALRHELPQSAQAAPFVACVTKAVRRELTSGALGRELAEDPDIGLLESERFERVMEAIATACVRQGVPAPSGGSVS